VSGDASRRDLTRPDELLQPGLVPPTDDQPPATTNPSDPQNQQPSVGSEDPPKWFKDFAEKVDRRITGLAEKTLPKANGGPAASEPAPNATRQADNSKETADLVVLGMEYGRLRSQLSDEAGKAIDGMLSGPDGLRRAVESAQLLLAHGKAGPNPASESSLTPPPGAPANSAPRSSPQHPKTMAEFVRLANLASTEGGASRERFERLMADDSFDPTDLPQR
jgi:hypothetical protein